MAPCDSSARTSIAGISQRQIPARDPGRAPTASGDPWAQSWAAKSSASFDLGFFRHISESGPRNCRGPQVLQSQFLSPSTGVPMRPRAVVLILRVLPVLVIAGCSSETIDRPAPVQVTGVVTHNGAP